MAAKRHRLAKRRKAVGLTQEELAERLGVDSKTIRRWESGETETGPQPWLRPKLARCLQVSVEQLEELLNESVSTTGVNSADLAVGPFLHMQQSEADAPPARYQSASPSTQPGTLVLRSIISSPRSKERPQVRAELLTHYEGLTDNYRQIDYQAGARAVYGETVAHLNRLLATTDRVPSSLYRRFVLGLGDAAQLAAWLAIDSQDYGAARQYCALALSSAEEGEDLSLHSYALGVMSYIHLHAGRGSEALRLLEAALGVADTRRFGVNPAVRCWLYEAMGEAYAIVGDRQAGARALVRAEQLFDAVCSDTVPHWLGFFNSEGHAARLKGRCLMRLGDGRSAITALEIACELLPDHYVREQSGTLIDLAAAHLLEANPAANSAEPATAADIAQEAWRLATMTESSRNQHRIRELLPAFAPYAHLETVQALTYAVC